MNDKELEEAANIYTSEYDVKLAKPELKALHLGYKVEKEKIKEHFKEGAKWQEEKNFKVHSWQVERILALDNKAKELEGKLEIAVKALKDISINAGISRWDEVDCRNCADGALEKIGGEG